MDFFVFLLFLIVIVFFTIIPFFILHGLSNVTSFLLYRVLGYRKKVVRNNLKTAFKNKSDKELKKIEKDFYLNLTDILLESFKGYNISTKTVAKRYKAKNSEIVEKYHQQGRSVILAVSHYANWEWGSVGVTMHINNDIFTVYKPIGNKYIDMYVRNSRSKNGLVMLPIKDTHKYFKKYARTASSFILISDQSPSNPDRAVWVNFLGKKTAFLHGIEFYSRIYNMPVIYTHIKRVKRGYYEVTYDLIHDNPQALKPGEITQLYANKVEEDIINNPSDWLWSHRRWKHTWENMEKHKDD